MTSTREKATAAARESIARLIAARCTEIEALTMQIDDADHPWVRAAIRQRLAVVREKVRGLRAKYAELGGDAA